MLSGRNKLIKYSCCYRVCKRSVQFNWPAAPHLNAEGCDVAGERRHSLPAAPVPPFCLQLSLIFWYTPSLWFFTICLPHSAAPETEGDPERDATLQSESLCPLALPWCITSLLLIHLKNASSCSKQQKSTFSSMLSSHCFGKLQVIVQLNAKAETRLHLFEKKCWDVNIRFNLCKAVSEWAAMFWTNAVSVYITHL